MLPDPAEAPRGGASRARREVVCALALLVPVLVLLWPLLLGGAPLPDYLAWFAPWRDRGPVRTAWNPLWYDAVGQYWPWRLVLADGLRGNCLPLWNPYQYGGYPFAANGQSALFYPPNWVLFGLLRAPAAFALTAIGHLWLAGYGTYRVVRELGGRRAAALVAGVAFELSGFLVTWLPLPTLVSSAAWLPAAVACLERAQRQAGQAWGAGAGLCLGLSALAGHPQIAYYVGGATLTLGLLRLGARGLPALGWCVVVAGLVSAGPLLPVVEVAPHGHRAGALSPEGYQGFLQRAAGADRLVTLFLPRFYGSPERGTLNPGAQAGNALVQARDGAYWGLDRRRNIAPGDYTEFHLFVGLLPLLLAGLAWRAGGPARAYGVVGLVALALACGAPLNRWLYFHLPGYSAGAGPCRLSLVWSFAVAVSAGCGLDAGPRRGRAVAVVAGLLVLGGLGAWWLAARLVAPVGLARVLEVTLFRRLVAGTAACGGLAIGALVTVRAPRWLPSMVALELLVAGWGLTPVCRAGLLDPAPLRAWLGAPAGRVLVKDPPRGWGFYAPPTGLALPPNLASAALWRDVGGYDSLALAGTRQRLNLAARGAPTSPAINGNMLLLGEVEALPPGTTLTVDGGRPWPVITSPRAPGQVVHDGANRVTLTGVSGQQTLYDTAYPGWRLLGADGRRLPWTGTVGGPRVWTLAAPELVRWVFAPLTVRLGLFLSLVGWALAIGCALGPRGERG